MSAAAVRLAATVLAATAAALLPACTLNVLGKDACGTTSDCINGYVCVSNHCVPRGAGGNSGGGGNGGNMTEGGADRLPPSMCPADLVTACPAADGGTSCEETRTEKTSARPEAATTTSISSGFDDDAMPSGNRAAIRRTASTAPGMSGGSSP